MLEHLYLVYCILPGTQFRVIIGAGGGYYFCNECPEGNPRIFGYCLDCAPNNETGAGGIGTYGGGGRTALQIWNASSVWEEISTAGGGGGGSSYSVGYGGAGGCDSGGDGSSYGGAVEGGKNAPDGSCLSGPPLRGISTRSYSGGGSAGSGSGWCGGFSFLTDNYRGSGGGSSWASKSRVQNSTCVPGYLSDPGENAPYLALDVARGGKGGSGGHGAAILLPFCGSAPKLIFPDGVIAPLLPDVLHRRPLETLTPGRLTYTLRCTAGFTGSDSVYTFNFNNRQWNSHVSGSTCQQCTAGTYSTGGGSACLTMTHLCAAGKFAIAGATADTDAGACTSCPSNTYTTDSATGQTSISSCTICAPGYYGSITNNGVTITGTCALVFTCAIGKYA